MKKISILMAALLLAAFSYAQENLMTLSGGYVFTNLEETDVNANGWRINGLYEFNPQGGKMAHGLSFGYASVTAESGTGLGNTTYDIGTIPIYYAPKFLFGSDQFKGFVKGAVGVHFSNIKREGVLGSLKSDDFGFNIGGGVGAMYFFNEKLFTNFEYELLWQSNNYYRDGLQNTAALGIGMKF